MVAEKGRGRKLPLKRDWLHDMFNCHPGMDDRSSFVALGSWADPAWEAVAKGMSQTKAYLTAVRVKKLKLESDEERIKALVEMLDDTTSEPFNAAEAKTIDNFRHLQFFVRTQSKRLIGKLMKEKGISAEWKDVLLKELEVGLKMTFEDFRKLVQATIERQSGIMLSSSRDDLRKACNVLRIPMPKKGEPVDTDLVNQHYRKLAKKYHPDRVGEGSKELFLGAGEARDILVNYNRNLETVDNA